MLRFGPVSDIKVCNKYGRYSIEVQVQSLFKDQTESWIRIVNSVDKFVREAMPIQEEEKASGKPATKARPILKPSSTSGWDFTPMEQRQWTDIEIQESKDPCFFKCRNSLLDYFDTVKKDMGQTKCRNNLPMFHIGQLTNGYQFWHKVEDRRKGFNIA